jgi:fermentation-respiration switch protein FrsA (DUF1100 family)
MTTQVEIAERTRAKPEPSVTPEEEPAQLPERARLRRAGRREYRLFLAAVGLVALPIVDDNFVQTEPGTSAGEHLASGLVPLAVLAATALVYPRLWAGLRATIALCLGVFAVAVGVPGAYYILDGTAQGDHYTALLAFVGAGILLVLGPVLLWRARRRGGSRRRRYLLRASSVAIAVVAAPLLFALVVFPIAMPYVYVHTGRSTPIPDLGVGQIPAEVTTSDGLELEAAYVPSKNGASVIVYAGATRTDEARMLLRHGYGVLLLVPRGQGRSEGDIVRWAGDRDFLAGAEYLQSRPDVKPGRIGAMGFSIGGEILLETAAKSTAIAAVVSEGAGERVGETKASGLERLLADPAMWMMTGATTVFGNTGPQPPIVDRIGLIAPRSVFLIYAVPGIGGEDYRQPLYYAAAGEPKSIWRVPGSGHTGGFETTPAEYERRVVAFFDQALRGSR